MGGFKSCNTPIHSIPNDHCVKEEYFVKVTFRRKAYSVKYFVNFTFKILGIMLNDKSPDYIPAKMVGFFLKVLILSLVYDLVFSCLCMTVCMHE